jgi:RNA polymerase sigma-70 factor (ECF subfamily)
MNKTPLLIPEERIVCLLKARDKKGFDVLYKLYANSLYSIALKIVRSSDIAEDVLQDSFIKIWRNIDTYDKSKGSLFTFILNITRNTAIDKTRSIAYKQEMNAVVCKASVKDERTYSQQVDFMGMESYIAKLTPQHQHLIQYVYFQGYTHDEAAKELGIPLGTVKSRLKAAIHKLRIMVV